MLINDVYGEMAFIGAILEQAYKDAVSNDPRQEPENARRFINEDCELFCIYCNLIGLYPPYVAKKMQARIEEELQLKRSKYGNHHF